MKNIICVLNTKGGVGKSIVSKFVLPAVLHNKDKKIKVYEIDNNNSAGRIKSNYIDHKIFKINDKNEAIFDVLFNEDEEDIYNIIDVGGGDDVKAVVATLAKNNITDIDFLIPTSKDDEQSDSVFNTIQIIKDYYKDPNITLAFNFRTGSIENIKDEYANFFGKEKWGLNETYSRISKDIKKVVSIPQSDIFLALKNQFQTYLLDNYISSKMLVKNEKKYRLEWKKEAKEKSNSEEEARKYYATQMNILAFARDVDDFVEELKAIFEV